MSTTTTISTEEGVTFFGKEPSAVLDAFHTSGLAAEGYSIACRIVRQSARLVDPSGTNSSLFDGEKLYAGTFIRTT